MATKIDQVDSDLEVARIDINSAGNLTQLKVALRKFLKHSKRTEKRLNRLRGEIRALKKKVNFLERTQ